MQKLDPLKIDAARSAAMAVECLKEVSVIDLDEERLSLIRDRVFPSFCYDNSLVAATVLDLESIVFGVASNLMGGCRISCEHAWVKDHNGNYYDPTYQTQLSGKNLDVEVTYFSAIEIPLVDYLAISAKIRGSELAQICGLDHFALRMSGLYDKQYGRINRTLAL